MWRQVEELDLSIKPVARDFANFLERFDLGVPEGLDLALGIRDDDGQLIAVAGKNGLVLQGFAVDPKYQSEGLAVTLFSELTRRLFAQGQRHYFVFTKPGSAETFHTLGCRILATSRQAVLFEGGWVHFEDWITGVQEHFPFADGPQRAAIVMNANPFTRGHLYLVEEASAICSELLIFVVEEERSLFPFQARFELVRRGTEHLANVQVLPSGPYVISQGTFPSYFIRRADDRQRVWAELDARLFMQRIAPALAISQRFVGEEPLDPATKLYNEALQQAALGSAVTLRIIPRRELDGAPISASRVRALLKEGRLLETESLLPPTSFAWLQSEAGQLVVKKIFK